MAHWKPNKEVLEDMLRELNAMPDKDEPLFGFPDGTDKTYSVQDMINEVANRTEFGREMYENFLELNYLTCKKEHSK